MPKLKIRISNNEYTTKDVPSGERMNKEDLYTSKSQRRKHVTRETKAVVDYHATMVLQAPKIKRLGYVESQDIIYRIVSRNKAEIRVVQVAVPKRGRHYINGPLLAKWIAKMDTLYPKGWEPVPKEAVEDEMLSITDVIEDQGPMSLDQLKGYVAVEDFDDSEIKMTDSIISRKGSTEDIEGTSSAEDDDENEYLKPRNAENMEDDFE